MSNSDSIYSCLRHIFTKFGNSTNEDIQRLLCLLENSLGHDHDSLTTNTCHIHSLTHRIKHIESVQLQRELELTMCQSENQELRVHVNALEAEVTQLKAELQTALRRLIQQSKDHENVLKKLSDIHSDKLAIHTRFESLEQVLKEKDLEIGVIHDQLSQKALLNCDLKTQVFQLRGEISRLQGKYSQLKASFKAKELQDMSKDDTPNIFSLIE